MTDHTHCEAQQCDQPSRCIYPGELLAVVETAAGEHAQAHVECAIRVAADRAQHARLWAVWDKCRRNCLLN